MRKRHIAALMTAVMTAFSVGITAVPLTAYADVQSEDISVNARTQEEIKAYYEANPFSLSMRDTYDIEPNINTETAGKLSDESVTNGLNALNFVRYIAGLDAVTIDPEYEEYAMAGTTLLTKVGKLEHKPSKPEGVSEEFYNKGFKGTSSSNIGWNYKNIASNVINGWMNDGDASNIDRVGHRRWCLDPRMKATGFGHSGAYTAMYSFDGFRGKDDQHDYVIWPAANMPVEFFQGPWNISFNKSLYNLSADPDALNIKLTNERSGETYTLTGRDKNKRGKYVNLERSGFGYGNSLIFEPNVRFRAGDIVNVEITGLQNRDGSAVDLSYTVNFFSMNGSSGGGGGSQGGSGSELDSNPLKKITLNYYKKYLSPDETLELEVKLHPSDADNAEISDVKWSSNNEAVASVDEYGYVTANKRGTAVITANLNGFRAKCIIIVRSNSSGGSGSSGGGSGSSGGNYGSGGGGYSGSTTVGHGYHGGASYNNMTQGLPSYVVQGNWYANDGNNWSFCDSNGNRYHGRWAAVHNPYADPSKGQQSFDWFNFDEQGRMRTGWFTDADGSCYYLNNASDGTRGRMLTGWNWIPDANGVCRCYYFNPVSDGTRGRLIRNATIEGNTVNADGAWTVNGVVQIK